MPFLQKLTKTNSKILSPVKLLALMVVGYTSESTIFFHKLKSGYSSSKKLLPVKFGWRFGGSILQLDFAKKL